MTATYFPVGLPSDPPVIDPETLPFWEAAQAGQLVLPYCNECRQYFWYPRGFCPRCGGSTLSWPKASGRGEIYSYSVVRRAFGAWGDHTPFVIAWVTLDEGVSVLTNVIDCTQEQLAIGLSVTAVFEADSPAEPPALRFIPAR